MEDIIRLLNDRKLADALSVSVDTARRLGKKSCSVVKIGRCTRYDVRKVNLYIERMNSKEAGNEDTGSGLQVECGGIQAEEAEEVAL